METTSTLPTNAQNAPLFTCMACQVAFYSADQQRTHYRTDWHRYNLKRKVADLPPATAESFAQRALARQAKAAEDTRKAEFSADCSVCKKSYSSENAFNNHLQSKKHKEGESRMLHKFQAEEDQRSVQQAIAESIANAVATNIVDGQEATNNVPKQECEKKELKTSDFPISDDDEESEEEEVGEENKSVDVDNGKNQEEEDPAIARRKQEREIKRQLNQATTEEEVVKLLEKKKAAAPRLNPEKDCLFCTHQSGSFEANMDHMSLAHSLFIPDLEYVVDLRGLIKYLADKLSVANVCLYCNGRGRVLQSLEAVQKHMQDKGHTKIAYETEVDIMEISDFYDFSSTYPDAQDHDGDEMLDDGDAWAQTSGVRPNGGGVGDLEEDDGELVLPNGNRIGHRSLQRYYKQSFMPEIKEKESVVINKMLTNYAENPEYSNQLVQASRNRAVVLSLPNGRQLWKDMATYKERRVREDHKTRVGIKANKLQRFYREQNPQ